MVLVMWHGMVHVGIVAKSNTWSTLCHDMTLHGSGIVSSLMQMLSILPAILPSAMSKNVHSITFGLSMQLFISKDVSGQYTGPEGSKCMCGECLQGILFQRYEVNVLHSLKCLVHVLLCNVLFCHWLILILQRTPTILSSSGGQGQHGKARSETTTSASSSRIRSTSGGPPHNSQWSSRSGESC